MDSIVSLIIERIGKNKNSLKKMKITKYTDEEQIVILVSPFMWMPNTNRSIHKLLRIKTAHNQETIKLLIKLQIQIL